MEGFGVIVEFCPKLNGTESLSCSGLYMGKGVVLTHGTIIIDVLKDKKSRPLLQEISSVGHACASQKNSLLRTVLQDTQSRFKVIVPVDQHIRGDVCVKCKSGDKTSVSVLPVDRQKHSSLLGYEVNRQTSSLSMETSNYRSLPAAVERLFVQPGIKESISKLMPASQGWKLLEDKEQNQHENETDLENLILSTFVLLKVLSDESSEEMDITDQELIDATEHLMSITGLSSKGTGVYVESSPFGSLSPSVFLNSLSCGVISNVSDGAGDILLTDARCVMGSEGAPVFIFTGEKKYLCGMVISPFCWRNGEWLGLTLLASVKPILQALLHSLNPEAHGGVRVTELSLKNGNSLSKSNSELAIHFQQDMRHKKDITPSLNSGNEYTDTAIERYLNPETISKLDESVVAVCYGVGWGSGVVVSTSPGIILTCSHVIQPAADGDVKIILSNGRDMPGRVIYQTRRNQLKHQQNQNNLEPRVWDLAVVVTRSPLPHALPLASHLPHKGSPVIVAGYGMFRPSVLPAPTLSVGIISKVIGLPVSTLYWQSYSDCKWNNKFTDKDRDEFSGVMAVNQVCDDVRKESDGSETCHVYSKSRQAFKDSVIFDNFTSDSNETNARTIDGRALINSDRDGFVPMLMQTSCAVYGGTSGGPVVSIDPQRGLQVIGIIVCNTIDTANKASFPHINLAVPIPAICEIIKTFLSSGDKAVLEFLEAECSAASHLWALGRVPQSRL